MKQITLLLTLFIFILGCSPNIQIYQADSANTKLVGDSWIFENDTVKLTYSFWAKKGVMSFSVYNKIDKPIYIDWKNSSFIINSDKFNYWMDEEYTTMISVYGSYYYNGPPVKPRNAMSTGAQASAGKLSKPERITFIPPKSFYYRSQFYLMPVGAFNIPKEQSDKNSEFKEITFSYSNSPLKFRNYLAISLSETSQSYFFIDNEFYVSSIKQMKQSVYKGKATGYAGEAVTYEYPFNSPSSFYIEIESQRYDEDRYHEPARN